MTLVGYWRSKPRIPWRNWRSSSGLHAYDGYMVGDKRLGIITRWMVDGEVLASVALTEVMKFLKNGVGRENWSPIGEPKSLPLISALSSFFVRLNVWQNAVVAVPVCEVAGCAGSEPLLAKVKRLYFAVNSTSGWRDSISQGLISPCNLHFAVRR